MAKAVGVNEAVVISAIGVLQYFIDTIEYGIEEGESPENQKRRAEEVMKELEKCLAEGVNDE